MAIVMAGWLSILQLLAVLSIVMVALGLMVGIVKTADAVKHIAAIMGIVIVLMLLPGIVLSAWSRLLFWQKLGLAGVALGAFLLQRPRRRSPPKHRD